jgi:hypothetical protein
VLDAVQLGIKNVGAIADAKNISFAEVERLLSTGRNLGLIGSTGRLTDRGLAEWRRRVAERPTMHLPDRDDDYYPSQIEGEAVTTQPSVGSFWADTMHWRANAGCRVAVRLEEAFAEVGKTKAATWSCEVWAHPLRFLLVPSQSGGSPLRPTVTAWARSLRAALQR